jgi:hypothetical protein
MILVGHPARTLTGRPICGSCGGAGTIRYEGESGDVWSSACPDCDGSNDPDTYTPSVWTRWSGMRWRLAVGRPRLYLAQVRLGAGEVRRYVRANHH